MNEQIKEIWRKERSALLGKSAFLSFILTYDERVSLTLEAVWRALLCYDPDRGELRPHVLHVVGSTFKTVWRNWKTLKQQTLRQAKSLDVYFESKDGQETYPVFQLAAPDPYAEREYQTLVQDLAERLSPLEGEVFRLTLDGYELGEIVDKTGRKYKAVDNAKGRVKHKARRLIKEVQDEI